MKNKAIISIISLALLFVSFYVVYMIGSNENSKNNVNSNRSTKSVVESSTKTKKTTTKTEDPKLEIKLSLGGVDNHTSGTSKIKVYVTNSSSKNIKYIKVNLFEKKDGRIVQSDWTNDSSLIKVGASQTIDTYFDFHWSESTLEVELSEVIFE